MRPVRSLVTLKSFPIHVVMLVVISGLCLGGCIDYTVDMAPQSVIVADDDSSGLVESIDLLGYVAIWPGETLEGREIGGLSAIRYDDANERYLILSDDTRSTRPPVAFVAQIDLSDGLLSNDLIQFTDVITFEYPIGSFSHPMQIDPEGLAIGPGGSLYVASEGLNRDEMSSPPLVAKFNDLGTFTPGADIHWATVTGLVL